MGNYIQNPGVGNPGGDHDEYPDDNYYPGINPFVIFLILILLLLGGSGYSSFYSQK